MSKLVAGLTPVKEETVISSCYHYVSAKIQLGMQNGADTILIP